MANPTSNPIGGLAQFLESLGIPFKDYGRSRSNNFTHGLDKNASFATSLANLTPSWNNNKLAEPPISPIGRSLNTRSSNTWNSNSPDKLTHSLDNNASFAQQLGNLEVQPYTQPNVSQINPPILPISDGVFSNPTAEGTSQLVDGKMTIVPNNMSDDLNFNNIAPSSVAPVMDANALSNLY